MAIQHLSHEISSLQARHTEQQAAEAAAAAEHSRQIEDLRTELRIANSQVEKRNITLFRKGLA